MKTSKYCDILHKAIFKPNKRQSPCVAILCVCVRINWWFPKFHIASPITNSGIIAGFKLSDSCIEAWIQRKPILTQNYTGYDIPAHPNSGSRSNYRERLQVCANLHPLPYFKRSRRRNSRTDICLNCARNYHFSHFHSSSYLNQNKKVKNKNLIPNLKLQEWKKLLFQGSSFWCSKLLFILPIKWGSRCE